jgi:phosphate:Na+ symporter
MDFGIIEILSLIGSVGMFLYGMKLMSDSLQKVAGVRLRAILAAITANRFKSIVSGLTITALIQSSSAVTVMIVSFVNAGLLSLTEGIGVIMGANIGTTLKAWIFVTVGLNFKITEFALPLFGFGFLLMFTIRNSRKYWGEFILGLALIFLGLDFLLQTVPDFSSKDWFISFITSTRDLRVLSTLLFFLFGMVLAALFQSSSAALALSLVLASSGIITFPLAIAMVLGENVGTTITANLAAILGNISAKKVARSHFLFNFLGVCWALLLFPLFLRSIDTILINTLGKSAYSDISAIPYSIAIAHSLFNVTNTLILVWFIPGLIYLSGKLVRKKAGEEEKFRLRYISKTIFSTSEVSLLQARNEIRVYAKRIKSMFGMARSLFNETNEELFDTTYSKIVHYEGICDRMETEITAYLSNISASDLSQKSAERVKLMLLITSNLEKIGDTIHNLSKALNNKRKNKTWFTQELRNNINSFFDLLDAALNEMYSNLGIEYTDVAINRAKELEKEINSTRNRLKADYLSAEKEKDYRYEAGVIYSEIFSKCERLGDHIYSVTENIVNTYKTEE